jgi:hypothetical protein
MIQRCANAHRAIISRQSAAASGQEVRQCKVRPRTPFVILGPATPAPSGRLKPLTTLYEEQTRALLNELVGGMHFLRGPLDFLATVSAVACALEHQYPLIGSLPTVLQALSRPCLCAQLPLRSRPLHEAGFIPRGVDRVRRQPARADDSQDVSRALGRCVVAKGPQWRYPIRRRVRSPLEKRHPPEECC